MKKTQDRVQQVVGTKLAEQLVAVQVGHHDVEYDEVGAKGTRRTESDERIVHGLRLEAFPLELVSEQVGQVLLVIDNENAFLRTHGHVSSDSSRQTVSLAR